MADIGDIEAAQSIKVIGAEADGTETTPVGSTLNGDGLAADILNNGGLDVELSISAGVAQEVKIGASRMANRKMVVMYAKEINLIWGFSSTTQSFEIRRRQWVWIPLGEDTEIWVNSTGGTRTVAIGEIA